MSEITTNINEILEKIIQLIGEGRVTEAEEICRQSLTEEPDNARLHNFLGIALQKQGLQSEALASYQQALALDPNYAQAYNNSGTLFLELNKLEEAFSYFQQAIALKPDFPEAYNNIGNIYQEVYKWEEALTCYRQALAINPNYLEAYINTGNVFKEQGKLDEALTCYHWVLNKNPNFVEVYNNIGVIFHLQSQLEKAKAYFLHVFALLPNSPKVYHNLATIALEQRFIESAIASYQQAIALKPNYADAHHDLGFALLVSGDFQRGFAEYEWRWQKKGFQADIVYPLEERLWDGSNLAGRTILLWAEQGFGDTLQFIRYASLVQKYGGRVIFYCPKELIRILKPVPGIEQLVSKGTPLPEFDVHTPLLILPRIFGTTVETIPAEIPYISLPPEDNNFKLQIPPNTKLKVGIVWASGYRKEPFLFRTYTNKSCPLEKFIENLLPIPGISLYSLQLGRDAAELEKYLQEPRIQDLSSLIHDFADTAALVAQLDLVITVDTAVAHLAGAMGKPVWVLLHFAHDWRWLLDRADSPLVC